MFLAELVVFRRSKIKGAGYQSPIPLTDYVHPCQPLQIHFINLAHPRVSPILILKTLSHFTDKTLSIFTQLHTYC